MECCDLLYAADGCTVASSTGAFVYLGGFQQLQPLPQAGSLGDYLSRTAAAGTPGGFG